jgi:aspartyl aminopeptidase
VSILLIRGLLYRHTWFDRDLSLAGRVLLRKGDTMSSTKLEHRLVKVDRPVLRIPNLAIHLRSAEEKDAFKVNKEDHLVPILCEEVKLSLSGGSNSSVDSSSDPWAVDQSSELLDLLATELRCEVKDIVDFELSVYDTQQASLSGSRGEFLCSSRLDNLASCFVAVESLVDHAADGQDGDADISLVALFDHEEVGSDSSQGAGSTLMRDAVVRIGEALAVGEARGDPELFRRAIARSFVLSVDMAHAIHPNYASKHESNHAPRLNGGVVIKNNANQRYATNGFTAFVIRELAKKAVVPLQSFVVRNDCACGSTIGPVIAHNTGMRAVDLGMPQLSMHSIREMMGGKDLTHGYNLMRRFLADFADIDDALHVDGGRAPQ